MRMNMKTALLASAISASVLAAVPASAATFIAFSAPDGPNQAGYAPGGQFDPRPAPSAPTGTLYITGLGSNISTIPGIQYKEDVSVIGTGIFEALNGTARFTADRVGLDPIFYVRQTYANYFAEINLRDPRRNVINQYQYNQVFTEKNTVGVDQTLLGNPFDIVTYVVQSNVQDGYSYRSDFPGNTFDMASNNVIIAPSTDSAPPVTSPVFVPEPASWAMMIVGLGVVGFARRRRGRSTALIACSA
jgi:hypothetical protein